MLWFGGFAGSSLFVREPGNARDLWDHVSGCWMVGTWPAHEVRTTWTDRRAVAVLGPCGITVDELANMAVRRVPDDVAWRWPGSYTVVCADGDGTTVWTDIGGAWPIYTLAADGGTFWASSSRALAGLTGNQVDMDWLAAWLLAPSVPGFFRNRSAFTGIDRVPPGHRLFLPATGAPVIRSMWRPRPSNGDHATRLRAELVAAVAVRVDSASTPTVDLSGGYDSTGLALLAAEWLHPDRTVIGTTLHPEGVTDRGDVSYARIAAEHPGIVHRLLPLNAHHRPYSDLDALPATDEPAPSTISHAHFSAQLDWLRAEFGSDCHITGDGGDSLLCSPPIMLADLIAARRYRRALVDTIRWARLRRLAVWPLLVAACQTACTSRTDALRTLACRWWTGEVGQTAAGGISWVPDVTVPPWVSPEGRRRAAAMALNGADQLRSMTGLDVTAVVTGGVMAEVGRSARADVQLAEHHGVALHNPFVDSRVIDTYLSVPLHQRPGPAEYKPILRDALADLLPASLAARRTKGSFSADFYQGLRANLSTVHDLVDGRLAELGLINPAALRHTLSAASAGVPVAFSAVEPAVAAEVWLRAIDAAPVVTWTTTTTAQPEKGTP